MLEKILLRRGFSDGTINMNQLIAALAIGLIISPSHGAATFEGLGDLPGGTPQSSAYDVSADGTIVVGESSSSAGTEALRWSSQTGMMSLGDLPGGAFSSAARAVSADGTTIVGEGLSSSGSEAFRWTNGSGIQGLGDFPGGQFNSRAAGVSGTGSVIVGAGVTANDQHSFRWTQAGGLQNLGGVPPDNALGVSLDGLIVVGQRYNTANSGWEAYRWTQPTGMTGLGDLAGGSFYSIANAVSNDGTTIVGQGFTAQGSEAFYWKEGLGMMGIGDLPGGISYSYAWDASANGVSIVGVGRTDQGDEAFIWDATNGMRNLRAVLIADYGIANLTGWTLKAARGTSADGRTIVGEGINPQGQVEAWRVTGVSEPPQISVQPSSQSVNQGQPLTMAADATGSGTISYRWKKDGIEIPGATSKTFTIPNAQPWHIGDYTVEASNIFGSSKSNTAAVSIQNVDSNLWKGLIAYFPLDGTAEDLTGLGNSGTSFGAVPTTSRNNTANKAYYLNGSSYIDFPVLNTRALGARNTGFTISMWVLPQSLGPIFGDYRGTATGGDQILAMQLAVDNFPPNGPLPNYLSLASRHSPALGLDYTLYRGLLLSLIPSGTMWYIAWMGWVRAL